MFGYPLVKEKKGVCLWRAFVTSWVTKNQNYFLKMETIKGIVTIFAMYVALWAEKKTLGINILWLWLPQIRIFLMPLSANEALVIIGISSFPARTKMCVVVEPFFWKWDHQVKRGTMLYGSTPCLYLMMISPTLCKRIFWISKLAPVYSWWKIKKQQTISEFNWNVCLHYWNHGQI